MSEQALVITTYPKEDLTGQQFNQLTVMVFAGRKPRIGGAFWRCQCTCGNQVIVRTGDLKKGQQSCGCLGSRNKIGDNNRTHGMSGSPIYAVWSSMLHRCELPSDTNYPKYGAKGIKVCERWQKFENFLADMGPRPSSEYSIDRKESTGDYTPDNCRWATVSEQNRNKRSARMLTLNGETRNMIDWANRLGISAGTIWNRLKLGWSEHDALTRPIHHRTDWQSKKKSQ